MQQNTTTLREVEFVEWLSEQKFVSYQQALEDEGYEDLQSLTLLSDEQIEELSVICKTYLLDPAHYTRQ